MLRNQLLLTIPALILHLVIHVEALPAPPPDTLEIGVPHVTVPIHRRYADNDTLFAQYHNQNTRHIARKYDALLENYERNTGQPYIGIPSTAERRAFAKRSGSTGSLTAVPDNSGLPLMFYAKMQIGTPAVEFSVDLDTGSCDLWVKGASCTGNCGGAKLDLSKSSTVKGPVGPGWNIGYVDGSSTSGSLYQDTVTLAGQTVTNQYVAVVTNSQVDVDSLMGMALPGIGTAAWRAASATSFIQTLFNQRGSSLPAPMFGFALPSSGGELTLGGVNKNRIKGDVNSVIQWNNVIQPAGFWAITVGSLKSSKSNKELGSGKTIAIDTGTTGISLDLATVQAFYSDPAAVDLHALDSKNWGEGNYAVPCDGSYTGTFVFNGQSYQINGKNLLTSEVPAASAKKGGAYCQSMLYYANTDMWIAGDAFMRQFYTVFDATDNAQRVGFAPLA